MSNILNRQIDGKVIGIMMPIPQYPLYSTTFTEYGIQQTNTQTY